MRFSLILLTMSACLISASVGEAAPVHPATRVFYVSATGNDRASGLKPTSAWRSVERVNNAALRPGDRVLFRGGDVFSGTTLSPRVSGAPQLPIVYGAYAAGRPTIEAFTAAVFLNDGVSHLTFRHLSLTTGATSPYSIFQSSATGSGSKDIRISHCRLFATNSAGISSKQPTDTDWTIAHNRVSRTGDSGIILLGGGTIVRDNLVEDVGLNKAIPWNKHGIYVKAPDVSIIGNVIRGFQANGVSLRFPNARVIDNSISRGPIGIGYFSESRVPGRSLIEGNRISDTSAAGFYYDPTAAAGEPYPRESFSVIGNTITVSGGAGLNLIGGTHTVIRVADNVIGGPYVAGIVAFSPAGGSYSEQHDRFEAAPPVRWNGADLSMESYRAASGGGVGDSIRP